MNRITIKPPLIEKRIVVSNPIKTEVGYLTISKELNGMMNTLQTKNSISPTKKIVKKVKSVTTTKKRAKGIRFDMKKSKMIRIIQYNFGVYTIKNKDFLKENMGKEYRCVEYNDDYVLFESGYFCHVFDCISIPKTKSKPSKNKRPPEPKSKDSFFSNLKQSLGNLF